MTEKPDEDVDWSLATWEGSQRESLRRWAKLPLENIIAALEEMQALNEVLHASDVSVVTPQTIGNVQETTTEYGVTEKNVTTSRKK